MHIYYVLILYMSNPEIVSEICNFDRTKNVVTFSLRNTTANTLTSHNVNTILEITSDINEGAQLILSYILCSMNGYPSHIILKLVNYIMVHSTYKKSYFLYLSII